jgi:hypothetical protein
MIGFDISRQCFREEDPFSLGGKIVGEPPDLSVPVWDVRFRCCFAALHCGADGDV